MENDNLNNEQPSYYQPPVAEAAPVWNNDEQPATEPAKGQAIASLVCGILGVLCCGPCAIAALILSIVARNNGNKSGMAKAGLILGIIGIAIWVINIILMLTGVLDFSNFEYRVGLT